MSVCVCVCLLSIEIQTAERIRTKLGTEVVLEGGGFLEGGLTWYPHRPGTGCVKGAWCAVHFGGNFITYVVKAFYIFEVTAV